MNTSDIEKMVVEKDAARLFAYGTCALALALIIFLPPVLIELEDRLVVNGSIGPPMSEEHLIWFVPIFGRGKIITSLWISELIVWLILTVAILFVSKNKQFRSRPALVVFAIMFLISAAIPVKRISYFDGVPNGEGHIVLGRSDTRSDQSVGEALRIIWSNLPTGRGDPAEQYFFNTIKSGVIAPAVLATWIVGIIVAGFMGFLIKNKCSVNGTPRPADKL